MFINTTHKLLTPPKKYLMSSGEYSTVAAEAEAEAEAGVSNQGQQSFPLKLHSMLNDATSKGFDGIISWNPDGCSFKIHQPAEFNDRIMRNYFKTQTKIKSFQRQLNLYGFTRIPNGPERGSYIHKYFVRDNPKLALNMARSNKNMIQAKVSAAKQVNSALKKQQQQPHQRIMSMGADEASFPQNVQALLHERMGSFGNSFIFRNSGSMMNLDDIMVSGQDLFGDVAANAKQQAEQRKHPFHGSPAAASVSKRLTRDEGTLDDEEQEDEPDQHKQQHTEEATSHVYSFPWKLYDMLEEVEKTGQTHICSWTDNGKAFTVHKVDAFLEEIMPNYFDQKKFESFRRQLNFYGFVRVSRGANRGTYSHEHFVKNDRARCKLILRLAPNASGSKASSASAGASSSSRPANMSPPPPVPQSDAPSFEASNPTSV